MEIKSKTEVLVVGFGPVGATIANLLGLQGIEVLAIDKATEIFPKPRAISLDNEALRVLQLAGLPAGAFDTLAIPEVRMHSPTFGLFARMRTAGCVDGHPRLVTFHQPDLEAALRKHVARHDTVSVELGVELLSLQRGPNSVRATLRSPRGDDLIVEARYIVGADGANSKVRELLGLGFEGKTYPQDWLIVDAKHAPTPVDHVEFRCDPRRPAPHMVAPGERQRWEFMLHPSETAKDMEHPDKICALLAPWGDPTTMEIERTAVYRFHARTVERFSRGRAFLAGDAAHITPPFVGQGLVAGLRDASNLAWKLAWVLRGRARSGILESYDQERRPHAKAMIRLARFMGELVMPRNRIQSAVTTAGFRLAWKVPFLRSYFEDLKIKPKNRFRHGLFLPRSRQTRHSILRAGESFPQTWVSREEGTGCWSDDVLGTGFSLVGIGDDPARHLGDTANRWQAAGGTCVQLCHRGQVLHRSDAAHVWEDVTGGIVPNKAPIGWAAVVRPDRTVMHQGPIAESSRLVTEALEVIQ